MDGYRANFWCCIQYNTREQELKSVVHIKCIPWPKKKHQFKIRRNRKPIEKRRALRARKAGPWQEHPLVHYSSVYTSSIWSCNAVHSSRLAFLFSVSHSFSFSFFLFFCFVLLLLLSSPSNAFTVIFTFTSLPPTNLFLSTPSALLFCFLLYLIFIFLQGHRHCPVHSLYLASGTFWPHTCWAACTVIPRFPPPIPPYHWNK